MAFAALTPCAANLFQIVAADGLAGTFQRVGDQRDMRLNVSVILHSAQDRICTLCELIDSSRAIIAYLKSPELPTMIRISHEATAGCPAANAGRLID
jgi:hypothetical protein